MAKETLAEKLAKKAFYVKAVPKSWAVHMQAFGPILEPAFQENYQARVHLTAALNKISRQDLKGGIQKLQEMQKHVETDADKAAWLFFMGLCFDMAGAKEQMLSFYQEAAEFGHSFYLPYLKVAKSAHQDGVCDAAETNYRRAIACLEAAGLEDQNKMILSSACANLASCLIMMHRFDEARQMLDRSEQLWAVQPGRMGTEAILYAAMGKQEQAEERLEALKQLQPQTAQATEKAVLDILQGKNPHFTLVQVDAGQITAFWSWFCDSQQKLQELLAQEDYDNLLACLQEELKKLFPFLDRDPELGIQPENGRCSITFADFYMVSLEKGYGELIRACPSELEKFWSFDIAH